MLCIIRPPLYMTSGLLPSSCSTAPYADEGIVHAIVKTMEHMSRRLHHIYVWAYLLLDFFLTVFEYCQQSPGIWLNAPL